MRSFAGRLLILSLVVLLFGSSVAVADVCNVPSAGHATIMAAVADPTCTEVDIATGIFTERVYVRRNLTISGDSSTTTTIEGRVVATGAGVELVLDNLKVDASTPSTAGCFSEAVTVNDGAILTGNNMVAVNSSVSVGCLFIDDFESADTSAWSSAVP